MNQEPFVEDIEVCAGIEEQSATASDSRPIRVQAQSALRTFTSRRRTETISSITRQGHGTFPTETLLEESFPGSYSDYGWTHVPDHVAA